jgi:hypothetical protein
VSFQRHSYLHGELFAMSSSLSVLGERSTG